MKRLATLRLALVPLLAGLLASCGGDRLAGKTTTTSNGGDLVALGPDGAPLAGCVALAARSWNPETGTPGVVDTLRGDASGTIALDREAYAFVEIQDGAGALGASLRRVLVADGDRRTIPLDTLRELAGRWADRAGVAQGRLFLDSSFQSASLSDSNGSFRFARVARGTYDLKLAADTGSVRSMGSIRLDRGAVRYTGSGNVLLEGDTTLSPLWIDDFESGTYWPLLRPSVRGVSPWFMWWTETDMILPTATAPDSILAAIGPDSLRPGRTFHARFQTTGGNALIAAGITNMELDLRARREVCLSYRTDSPLRIEFQRDSVGAIRPVLSSTLPAAPAWRDTCAATADFVPASDTPDSLSTWDAFARRVLVIQFVASTGATHLDLDDIRLR